MRKDELIDELVSLRRMYDCHLRDSQETIDRLEAEARASEADARYRELFENASIGAFRATLNGTFLDINPAMASILGYGGPAEALGGALNADQHTHFDAAELSAWVLEAIRHAKAIRAECGFRRKDGALRKGSLWLRCVCGTSGKPSHMEGFMEDVSGQRQLEEDLLYSREFLRSIIDNEPECVKLVDEHGVLVDMNPSGLRMVGADSRDDVIGKRIDALVDKEFREDFTALNSRAIRGEPGDLRFRITGLKGGRLWLESHAVPFYDSRNGRPLCLAVTRDITRRMKAEESLRQYEKIVSASPDQMAFIDVHFICTAANDAFLRKLGRFRHNVIGHHMSVLIGERSFNEVRPQLERCFHGEELNYCRWSSTGTDIRHMDITLSPHRGQNGNIEGVVMNMRDVTEMKLCEIRISESERNYRSVVDTSPLGVYITDIDGRIALTNPAHCNMFECSESELVGRYHWELMPDRESADEFRRHFQHLVVEQPPAAPVFSRHRSLQGRVFDAKVLWNYIRDSHGNVTGFCSIVEDITDKKKAEHKLRDSEAMFRAIFDNANDGILLTCVADRRFAMANRKFLDMTGYGHADLMMMGIDDIHPAESLGRVTEQFELQSRGDLACAESIPVLCSDGSLFVADVNAAPIELGGRQYLVGIFRDMTEKKAAAASLKEISDRLSTIIEYMPAGCIIWNKHFNVELWNPQAGIIFGFNSAEAFGVHATALMADGKMPPYLAEVRDGLRPASAFTHFISENRTKDRGLITCEWYNTPMMRDGRAVGVISMVHDVTERMLAEERLKRTLREKDSLIQRLDMLNKAIEATQVGVTISDVDRRIVYVNPSEARMHGYEPRELMGRRTRVYSNLEEESQARLDDISLAKGWVRESRNVRKDGTEFPVLLYSTSIDDPQGCPVMNVTLCEDMTRIKQAEAMLKDALQQKETLLKEVHHRVKNNMHIVTSLLSLQARYSKDAAAMEHFRKTEGRIKAMALVHEKLYQSESLSHINTREYMVGLIEAIYDTYVQDRQRIGMEIEAGDFPLDIDSLVPCGLIVNELITNSLKYAFGNGRRGMIRVCIDLTGDGSARLSVSDDGVGMPEGFDLRQSRSLGLKLVNNLATQLRGSASFDSNGAGSSFTMHFPYKPEVHGAVKWRE